jgi:hypothetical protein
VKKWKKFKSLSLTALAGRAAMWKNCGYCGKPGALKILKKDFNNCGKA